MRYDWDVNADGSIDQTTTEFTLAMLCLWRGDYKMRVTVSYGDGTSGQATAGFTIHGFCRSWGGSDADYFNAAAADTAGNVYGAGASAT